MKLATRNAIDSNTELAALVNSDAWAADSQGELYRQAMDVLLTIPGVTEADATEWLHEDDDGSRVSIVGQPRWSLQGTGCQPNSGHATMLAAALERVDPATATVEEVEAAMEQVGKERGLRAGWMEYISVVCDSES